MNRETARQHLIDWRAGQEPSSPGQSEALRLLESDPILAEWFGKHCQLQADLRDKLRTVPVPAGLKSAILRGMPPQEKIVRPGFSRMVLLAASVVVLLSLGVLYFRSDTEAQLTAFRSRMVGNALRNYRMDLLTPDLGQIRSYLAGAHWPADYQLPANLEKLPGWGCARLTWQAKPVSMICFATNGRPDLYLFVADQQDVGGGAANASVQIQKDKRLITATWTQAGKLYLLTGEADEKALKAYLPQAL